MKNVSRNIQKKPFYKSIKAKLLSLMLAFSLVFSCFIPSVKAYADTTNKQPNNIDNLIGNESSTLNSTDNSILDQGLIPGIKSPFVNPLQTIINTIYKKIFGPTHTLIEKKVNNILNWIFGIKEDDKKSPEEMIQELKESITKFSKTFEACNANVLNVLSQIRCDSAKEPILTALRNAQVLFENDFTACDVVYMNKYLELYNQAKKEGNTQDMKNYLKLLAGVYGSKNVLGDSKSSALATSYIGLFELSLKVGSETSLDRLYDKTLVAEQNLDKVAESFSSLYQPFITLLNKLNDYQVMSLVALREHDNMCTNPKDKIAPLLNDGFLEWAIKGHKDNIPKAMKKLANLNERIEHAPNVLLTTQTDKETNTVRYHSFADAWVAAQADGVKCAKLTLNTDYVYNNDKYNYFGNEIESNNKNMRFDLSPNNFLNGDESRGYFKNGNLNVKSGKKIEIDLNSHTLANLTSNTPTIHVDSGATLNVETDMSDGISQGQIGGIYYENGSAGNVHNVKLSDKYNFKKFDIQKTSVDEYENYKDDTIMRQQIPGNNQTNATYTKFEYKNYENVSGAERKTAVITHRGAGKNFEVTGCNFDNINNTGNTSGTAIDIYTVQNMTRTDQSGKVVDNCAGTIIQDCVFTNCKSAEGSAISSTKHLNFDSCTFEGCSSKGKGSAVRQFQIEGDSCDMKDKTIQFDPQTTTFNNCRFNNNTSQIYGGALHIIGEMSITNSEFTNNSAASGGAICQKARKDVYKASTMVSREEYNMYDDVVINNSTFNSNYANIKSTINNDGGAICTEAGDIKTNQVQFTNNNANHDGGSIFESSIDKWIRSMSEYTNTLFENNNAGNNGGGLVYESSTKFKNVTIKNNFAGNNGGGAYGTNSGSKLEEITVKNNKCKNGRGAGMFINHEVFLNKNVNIIDNYIANGEPSDLRVVNRIHECISPEWGFYQGGSNIGLDLKNDSSIITDKKTKTSNKDWVERINAAKQYMHVNDGRSIQVKTSGILFWKKYWLQAC